MKAFVIGYRNHAARIINYLIESKAIDRVLVFHLSDKSINEEYLSSSKISMTSIFSDVLGCDLVFIASPSSTHIQYLKKLNSIFKTKLPYIYCEKPAAVSYDEIDYLKRNSNLFSKKVFFGFNLVYSNWFKNFSSSLKEEKCGKPVCFLVQITHGLAFKENMNNNWRFSHRNIFSSITGNLAIHFVHASLTLFGEIEKVNFLSANNARHMNEDTVIISIEHKNGVLSNIFSSYATVYSKKISLFLSDGELRFDGLNTTTYSPRDSFDEFGNYKTPPIISKTDIIEHSVNSLHRAIEFFISKSKKYSEFEEEHYFNALKTSELILSL